MASSDICSCVSPPQVLLGLGLATLIAAGGAPAIVVANVDGVRVCGVLLQAGGRPTDTLLLWGDGTHPGNAARPSFMHDVFARVGGPDTAPVQARTMVRIRSGFVIGDNLWLWRADHGVGGLVVGGANPCETGLSVEADDVTMYSLAVEHTLKDLTAWSGERGATFFYQSELPYDVTQAYGDAGYAGYAVAPGVAEHDAHGVGVYHYFRDHAVTVTSGIRAPAALAARFISPLSVYLNGNGTLRHVINSQGNWTSARGGPGDVSYVCAPNASAAAGPAPRVRFFED